MRKASVVTGIVMLLGCAAVPAQAAMETVTIDFSASGFSPAAPTDPLVGSVTVTLDPAVDATNDTSGITLNSLNIPLDSVVGFTYDSGPGAITIGGVENGVSASIVGTDDFFIIVRHVLTAPAVGQADYTLENDNNFYRTFSATLTVQTDVPEPASLLLLASALAGLGVARRRR